MNRFVLLILIILIVALNLSAKADVNDDFSSANEQYEEKNYDSSVVLYQDILAGGVESPALYFNLGNASFRSGDIGHAILYYLKAQRLDPTDPDIAGNLEFARRFTSIKMEGVELNPVGSMFNSLVAPYRLNDLAWLSSVLFVLLFVLLTVRYGLTIRTSLTKTAVTVATILLVASTLLTTVKYENEYLTTRGVVIAEDAAVRTGPTDNSEIELEAAPGLTVEILSHSGSYYNVLFKNKRRGWLHQDLVAVI